MAPADRQITGKITAPLKDYSTGKKFHSKDLPAPLCEHTDGAARVSKWPDSGRLAIHGCTCGDMEDLPRILLITSGDELMQGLSQSLDPCPLEIRTLKSCLEAGQEIGNCTTALVIFTDVRLPDGNWRQVLQIAAQAPASAEVIVVSRFVDVPLYLDALEVGAFDFVVPPFRTVELGYIIVNAIYACFKQPAHRFSGNFCDAIAI